MRVLSYIIDRVSATITEKDNVLPFWADGPRKFTVPLKEIVIVKNPTDKPEKYDMSSRLPRLNR